MIKPAAAHQRTECMEALLWLNLSIALRANLDGSRQAAELCHRQPPGLPPAVGGTARTARLLDDDLLPLHFRGTSYAPAITMPAVYQA